MTVLHPLQAPVELLDQAPPIVTTPIPAVPGNGALGQSMPEFLAWVSRRPRTYAETMEAWQTSCPRNSVWEDGLSADLIQLVGEGSLPLGQTAVSLTAHGQAMLGWS